MDFNPFDQFASEMGSALPPHQHQPNSAPEPSFGGQQTFDLTPKMTPATAPPKPVMNSGTSMNGQQQYSNSMPMGAPMGGPPSMGAPMMGGPPPPYQQQQQQWGGGPMAPSMPPQQQPNPFSAALVPSAMQSNPYALGPPAVADANPFHTMTAQPPQPGHNPWDMSPAPASPWGPPPSPPRPPMPIQESMSNMYGPPPGSHPFQAPTPPPPNSQHGGDMGLFFGGPPTPVQAPNVPPSQHSMVPASPHNMQMQQHQPPDAGRPQLNQKEMSLSNVFGAPAPADQGGRPQLDQREASLSSIFGAPTSSAPPPAYPPAPTPSGGGGDSFGGLFDSAPAPPVDPWGGSVVQPETSTALVVSNAVDDDPFGLFGAPAPIPPAPIVVPTGTANPYSADTENVGPTAAPREGGLPAGGEFYDAKIFTPTLGVMFFKPQELLDSLFLQTDRDLVQSLDERPVVAFIVEGSSARSAGVELGHVLLKVNGIDVKNPKDASRLIKEGPRPLPLLFYVPDTTVVVAEGEHMVKYDTKETIAPASSKDWKPKYVVVGGIIAQNWMLNMYRSKSEYDIAVIETQARRPVSVKVKQFSLQGARIQNDWQGPQMVKYKNKLHPWKYFVVLPVSRNPIKISSPNLTSLKPVHEGIRRVLASQQRDRGAPGPNTAAPIPRQMPPPGASPTGRGQYGEYESSSRSVSSNSQYPHSNYGPPSKDPYSHSAGPPGPYAQPPAGPYAAPSGAPYGQQPEPNRDPYAQPNGTGYPYGQQQQQGRPNPVSDSGGVAGERRSFHPEYRY